MQLYSITIYSIRPVIPYYEGSSIMAHRKGKHFADKHDPNVKPDNLITSEILKLSPDAKISCNNAFKIAQRLGVSADLVGLNADLIEVKLIKCQLGLFGYRPQKNIVKPQAQVNPELKDAILNARINGNLSCKSAWEIARNFNIPKMTVSGACETLNIKIKPCQLGAF